MSGGDKPISLADDADLLRPAETARRLAELTADDSVAADYYGNGGAVAEFEAQVAAMLGKERAVLFPTGTMANLIGLERLTGPAVPGTGRGRIVAHRDSHFCNDMGDALSQLGGFPVVPVAGAGAGYDADALAEEIARAHSARVAARIAAVTLETPSRRLNNRSFGPERMAGVVALARAEGLPLFLDGARLLMEAGWHGADPAAVAAPFDLVYLSLYKFLDAPFGCVLAGRADLLEEIHHDRRRHGGSLWEMWPAAVLAGAALPRMTREWPAVRAAGEAACTAMAARGLVCEAYADGTNVVRLPLPATAPRGDALTAAGRAAGLKLPPAAGGALPVKMNASWLRIDPEALAERLAHTLCV